MMPPSGVRGVRCSSRRRAGDTPASSSSVGSESRSSVESAAEAKPPSKKRQQSSDIMQLPLREGLPWTCKCGEVLAAQRSRCGKCKRWKGGTRAKKQKSCIVGGVNHPPRLAVGGDDSSIAPSAADLYRKLKMSSDELEAALVLGSLANPRRVDGEEAIRSECEVVIGRIAACVEADEKMGRSGNQPPKTGRKGARAKKPRRQVKRSAEASKEDRASNIGRDSAAVKRRGPGRPRKHPVKAGGAEKGAGPTTRGRGGRGKDPVSKPGGGGEAERERSLGGGGIYASVARDVLQLKGEVTAKDPATFMI